MKRLGFIITLILLICLCGCSGKPVYTNSLGQNDTNATALMIKSLNEVPSGGTIELVTEPYTIEDVTTNKPVDNILIQGQADSVTVIHCQSIAFKANGMGWIFRNLTIITVDPNGKGIDMSADQSGNWYWENVTINGKYYAYNSWYGRKQ